MSFPDHLTPDPDGPPAGGDQYTERDIDTEVFIIHEGVGYYDKVVRVTLPDGQTIIGPELTCAHLFARFTMKPQMMAHSDAVDAAIDDGEVDA